MALCYHAISNALSGAVVRVYQVGKRRGGFTVSLNRTWVDVFAIAEVDQEHRGAAIAHMRQTQAEIISVAAKILGREPRAKDVNQELVEYVLLRIARNYKDNPNRKGIFMRRVDHFRCLVEYCKSSPNYERVDDSNLTEIMKVAWPSSFGLVSAEKSPEPTKDDRPGFDAALISTPLKVIFDDHYKLERLLGRSDNTVRLYHNTLRKFGKWLGRSAVVGDLTQRTVLEWLKYLLEQPTQSAATVEKDRHLVCALWRYCARKRWVDAFPEIPKIPVPERIPDTWDVEEMQALMTTCQQLQGNIGKVPASLWWEALIRVVHDTAERVSAALAVRWEDLDKDGWLTIRAEARKRKTRDRRFRLRESTIELLRKLRQHDQQGEVIFVWPYTPTYIWGRYRKILQAAGLPVGRRQAFHKWRRTAASEFEAAGGNATELLDHSDRKTTKLYYLNPKSIKSVQPADICPDIGQEAVEPSSASDDVAGELRKLLAKLDGKKSAG